MSLEMCSPSATPWLDDMKRRGRDSWITLMLSGLAIVLTFVAEVIGSAVVHAFGGDEEDAMLVSLFFACLAVVAGIVALGGRRLLWPSKESLLVTLRTGWWAIVVSLGLAVMEISDRASIGSLNLVQNLPYSTFRLVLLCLAVGVSEECLFRGLLLEGFLDPLGRDRRGMLGALLITSALFGIAHIEWWSISYGDPIQWLQAALKVGQTGIYGFYLGALVMRTRSLVGSFLLHGLDDFLLLFPSVGLRGESANVQYVVESASAAPVIGLSVAIILLYVPLAVLGMRLFRQSASPDHGAFHKG